MQLALLIILIINKGDTWQTFLSSRALRFRAYTIFQGILTKDCYKVRDYMKSALL